LELPQLLQSDGMTEMNIRRRRVDAQFDAERTTGGQFFLQLFAADDFRTTAAENFKGFGGTHALNGDG
jgi:hypothetical protein